MLAVNAQLNKKLLKFRPNLSKSSIRVYSSTCKRVAKFAKRPFSLDMSWIDNSVVNKVLEIKENNKKKNFLTQLVNFIIKI